MGAWGHLALHLPPPPRRGHGGCPASPRWPSCDQAQDLLPFLPHILLLAWERILFVVDPRGFRPLGISLFLAACLLDPVGGGWGEVTDFSYFCVFIPAVCGLGWFTRGAPLTAQQCSGEGRQR